jgi:hypothetical protein
MKRAPVIAVFMAASMWIYFTAILKTYQKREAAAHDHPRGNLSDLYPRWLGARELLLHGRDPYSPEITREIQEGYYGRVLDPARPGDPKDQAAFAYPVYVIFLLAPTIHMTFEHVEVCFRGFLWIITAISVLLWLRVLHWKPEILLRITIVVLTLGSIYVIQGIKLQQLSLLVAFLLAASFATVARGYLAFAGALLALATIKPQLALLPVAWLLSWSLADWRDRWHLLAAFSFVMIAQLAGGEAVLPGWMGSFIIAIRNYHSYTNNQSLIQILSSPVVGYAIALLLLLLTAWLLRKSLQISSGSVEFGLCGVLVLTLVVLTVPMFALYNQVLLLPALLLIVRDWEELRETRAGRLITGMTAILVVWPWLASLVLDAGLLAFPKNVILDQWKIPFYTTFALPPLVFTTIAYRLIQNQRPQAVPISAS